MSSNPASPSSEEGSSSSRSDWFRQSVLFWSSQSERSERSNSFVEDDAMAGSRLSPELGKTVCDTPPWRYDDDQGEEGEQIVNKPTRNIMDEFDPSDLLKQVEELERCFKKSKSEIAAVGVADDLTSVVSSGSGSPHLTLEFPVGSSIKTNPLFKKDQLLRKKQSVDSGNVSLTEEYSIYNFRQTEGNKVFEGKVEDDTEEKDIIESIQKVQNTLSEISREIELSSAQSRHTDSSAEENDEGENNTTLEGIDVDDEEQNRKDPNTVMRDWLSNIKPPPPTAPKESGTSKQSAGDEEIAVDIKKECVLKVPQIISTASETNHDLTHEELFEKIDELMDFQCRDSTPDNTLSLSQRRYGSGGRGSSVGRERLDSGLQSVSSDSTSPYPSPNVNKRPKQHKHKHCPPKVNIIHEVLHESATDHVFRDDSDFSDWSPISTLDSTRGSSASISRRQRSQSVTYSPRNARQLHDQLCNSTGHMTNGSGRPAPNNHEIATIQKFLALTNKYLDKDGTSTLESTISLDDLALLPSLKETITQHRKELEEQRRKQEEFLHQLGDLLLEVVTLKEEHSTVRTKQTKALNLLKKQLDAHKKNQSLAHSDVINKVKDLNEKLNTSLSFSAEHLAASPSLASNHSFTFGGGPSGEEISPNKYQTFSQRGHIIWKISDVMKKLARVKTGSMEGTVVSPPFQTGEYGYRMNGWLYLNGRGKTAGRYLSLYVCVLVGDYDAILKWPIKPSYTLTLIDQNGDTKKRHDHVKVRRVIDIAGRGANVISQYGGIPRPSDCTKALIVGFDDFISHEQLLERRYLADDTLFLQIEANVS